MEPNPKYATLASDESINKAVEALTNNGFIVTVVEDKEAAKKKALELIPEGSEVYNTTSKTLDAIGVAQEIMESGKYDAIRKKIYALDAKTEKHEQKKLGGTPVYMIGSVHAVTEDGKALIASNSGSQIPGYAHGADHLVWVVSTKKIVKDLEDGLKRIYEYSLPLENVRAHEAYGVPHSNVRKILIFNSEIPNRINIIFVKEDLGF